MTRIEFLSCLDFADFLFYLCCWSNGLLDSCFSAKAENTSSLSRRWQACGILNGFADFQWTDTKLTSTAGACPKARMACQSFYRRAEFNYRWRDHVMPGHIAVMYAYDNGYQAGLHGLATLAKSSWFLQLVLSRIAIVHPHALWPYNKQILRSK